MKTIFRASSQKPLYCHPESKSYAVFRGEVPSTQTCIATRDYKMGGPYSAEKVRKETVVERKFAGRCAQGTNEDNGIVCRALSFDSAECELDMSNININIETAQDNATR